MEKSIPFVHVETGWPVVLSMGIGDTRWSVYLRKPNGSLRRCKQFSEYATVEEAERRLEAYIGKTFKRLNNVYD